LTSRRDHRVLTGIAETAIQVNSVNASRLSMIWYQDRMTESHESVEKMTQKVPS